MNDQNQNSGEDKKPSHLVYTVKEGKNRNEWNCVGAAWPHKDGKGFNIKAEEGIFSINLVMLDYDKSKSRN